MDFSVSVHIFMLIANSVSFCHISERNTSTFLSIYISHVLMEKIFRSPLCHHSCLIKLTLLQLHQYTLLIKLMNIASSHHIPYTCPLIKLTVITPLHHNCYTRSISKLHHSNIISHCSVSTHLIPSDFQLVQLKFIFISFSQTFASYSIFNYIWNTLKLLLLSGNVEINPGPRPIDQNPVFCTICFRKINRGPQQDMKPTCSNEICSARFHQACKLVMRKILVTLSSGNAHNMALDSPKLSYYLLQSMNDQINPLLLENLAPFA